MSLTPVSIVAKEGLDMSLTPSLSRDSFYRLIGFKQDETEPGKITQVRRWVLYKQLSQGTYYSGGSQTEPATSHVTGIFNGVIMTDYVAWTSAYAQIQVFFQTTVPSGGTATKMCKVVINNVAAFGITLGDTFQVIIDGATTFQWRKNGGAFTSLIPITTSGVSIDGGNATVYFLTDSGFTVNDYWTWTRTDRAGGTFGGYPINYTQWQDDVYYVGYLYQIMKATIDTLSVKYIISVGYNPIYGAGVATFFNHLMVLSYSTNVAVSGGRTVGNSDLNDLDCFLSTDVNEADTFTLPVEVKGLSSGEATLFCFSFRGLFYVVVGSLIYYTSYLGLPTVFSYQKLAQYPFDETAITARPNCCAEGSTKGVYMATNSRVVLFDGANFNNIAFPIFKRIVNGRSTSDYHYIINVAYVPFYKEVWFTTARATGSSDPGFRMFCYQEDLGTWYERYADFGGTGFGVNCVGTIAANTPYVGVKSLRVVSELINEAGTSLPTVYDNTLGTVYGVPTIVTQMLSGGNFAAVKEISSAYVRCVNTATNTTLFSVAANCVVNIKWILSQSGEPGTTVSSDAAAVWNSTLASNLVSLPRVSFRGVQMQLDLTPADAAKPPMHVDFYGLDLMVANWPQTKTDR